MGRLSGFIRILRPVNSVMVGFGVLVGIIIAAGLYRVELSTLALAFITGFTLTGSAMVINDYFDRQIDSVNEPGRPIPSGEVNSSEAIVYSLVLSIVGLCAAYLTGLKSLSVAIFAWLVMMSYSAWGKRTGFPGNIMVSICIALPFIYGGVIAGNTFVTIFFSLLAFLSNTGREVTKGIVDIEGDRGRGVRTVAVSYGPLKASYLASTFYFLSIVVSVAPYVLGMVSFWYIPFVIVTDAGLIYSAIRLLRDHDRETSRHVKNQTLYWMLLGLIAFTAGSLT